MDSVHSDPRNPLDETFDAFVQTLLQEWHVPGMSIAVVDGDQTFAKGYGIAAFPSEPVTPETLFYTASTTKSFTSAAISLLIDDDAEARATSSQSSPASQNEPLTWKTRLASLIPDDFVLPDSYATAHATIEDALCHRTGMPDHESSFGPSTTNVAGTVRNLRHLPMTSELREEFMYNNIMYTAISHVLETRTGENMGVFLRDRIWAPLGMTRTCWTLEDAIAAEKSGDARLARGYAWDAVAERYVAEALPDFPGVSGSGAIISNVLDYSKWLKCMMTRSAPLSAAGHASIVAPRIVVPIPGNNPYKAPNLYALGWYVDTYRGEKIIWHAGGWTGFGSVMAFLPDRQWSFVMMGNTSRTSNYVQMMLYFRLLDRLLETPLDEQVDWNARWKKVVGERRGAFARARERLYPFVPIKPTPPSLPLDKYAGSYSHPGYGAMNFVVDGVGLTADRTEQEVAMEVKLEHVSGEFWLAFLHVKNRDDRDVEAVRAEFYISADGKAGKFGIELEPRMGSNKIWFIRLDN
ncbi:hypothetical protein V500_09468 [Pseudogymnoascus sp. VKM F-4518 (FW-2643)]|nr:hypothetical protein V500_09468 [Pseudogymnoascus sp. VKM F-4518 (FW-2643)]